MILKNLRLLPQLLYSGTWIILFIFFCFYYPFSFNYEIEFVEQYKLIFLIPITGLLLLVFTLKNKEEIQSAQIIFLLIAVIIGAMWLLSNNYSFSNEHFSVVTILFLFSGICLFIQNKYYLYLILIALVCIFVYELYLGYVQFFEAKSYSENITLQVQGSLQNSGIYSCYLLTQLPLAYHILVQWSPSVKLCTDSGFKIKASIRIAIFSFLFVATAFLIYTTQSRTAYIAFIAGLISVCIYRFGNPLKRKISLCSKLLLGVVTSVIIIIISVVGYYLFTMKQLSAMGRLMKLDITMQHYKEYLITGTGLGRFTLYYPQWQAAYFENVAQPSSDYYFSAGESYIVFNEYLQLFKEVGLIGFAIFITVLFFFFRLKATYHKPLLLSLKSTVICILFCGFTSYPFHVNSLILILFTCIAAGFSLGNISLYKKSYISQILMIQVLIVISISSYIAFSKYVSIEQWKESKEVSEAPLKQYDILYENLGTDGKFLTDYGIVLLQNKLYAKAENILLTAEKYIVTRQQKETLADAMAANSHFQEAINVRQWLCNYLPNKFNPQYLLMELYKSAGDTLNAKVVAQKIISMPVKKTSVEVNNIIAAAKLLINK